MAQQTENVDFRLSAQDRASPVFRDVQRGLDGLAKQAFDARAILGTLGAAVSAQQFVSMILGATETTARYKDLAEIAGTTAEKISGLEAPARLAGTSLDTIAASVARLGRSIGEARLGDVGKASLFKALGIDPADGRDAADIMVDVARVLSGMTDQTIAGKVANDLLGRSYAELRPFMRELTEQGVDRVKERYAVGTGVGLLLLEEELARRQKAGEGIPDEWLHSSRRAVARGVLSMMPAFDEMAREAGLEE